MPTYDIVRRGLGQHRPGHFAIHIDGVDTEYTNDPAQHVPRFVKAALAEGLSPADAAAKADEQSIERSKEVLERITLRIRQGVLFAGGAPLGPSGIDAQALPRTQKTRGTHRQAVTSFLNRGRLCGLDEGARAARRARQDEKRNHHAEWIERRKALIADRNQRLEKLQLEVGTCAKENLPKLQRMLAELVIEIAGLHGGVYNATHGFQYFYGQLMTKAVDLVNDDIRIVPLMTNTTADTERDAKDSVGDFTTLDEFDGSGYSTGGLQLDSQAVNIDDANDRAEFDAADEVVATLGAGTRAIQGILLISWITNLSSSLNVFWNEFASNQTPGGGQFTFVFNAEGIVQASG